MDAFPSYSVTNYTTTYNNMIITSLPKNIVDHILNFTNADTRQMWVALQGRRLKKIHDGECFARILWCLAQGPAFCPAHEHKHRAPGDDRNFFYGIPPWHADGSVNPAGVPPNFGEPEPLDKNWALLDDWNADTGWNCGRCEAWVPRPPRKFEGAKEPPDWWWCMDCRRVKARAPSLAEKRQQKAAANCRSIDTYVGNTK